MNECLNCSGNGYFKCGVCNGVGKVMVEDLSFISCIGRSIKVSRRCSCCNGTGWQICSDCNGTGKIEEKIPNKMQEKEIEKNWIFNFK